MVLWHTFFSLGCEELFPDSADHDGVAEREEEAGDEGEGEEDLGEVCQP